MCDLDEAENYMDVVPYPVRVLAFDVKGIAHKRHEIGLYCQRENIETFVMLDDDLKFIRREDPSSVKLTPVDSSDMNSMFSAIRRQLGRFAHVGVSARQGNNNVGVGSPDILVDRNTRIMRVLAYRTKDFLDVEHKRVELMEDFDVTLQLLRKGKPNINLYWWAQDQDGTNAIGGCSEFRTHERHAQAVLRLQELHPAFVKLVDKENKTGGAFGKRKEVRVQWKAAFEEGIRYVSGQRPINK